MTGNRSTSGSRLPVASRGASGGKKTASPAKSEPGGKSRSLYKSVLGSSRTRGNKSSTSFQDITNTLPKMKLSNTTLSNSSIVDTDRKKGRALAAFHRFQEEVTPRTAIEQFVEAFADEAVSSSKYFGSQKNSQDHGGSYLRGTSTINASSVISDVSDNSSLVLSTADSEDSGPVPKVDRKRKRSKVSIMAEELDPDRDINRPTNATVDETVNISDHMNLEGLDNTMLPPKRKPRTKQNVSAKDFDFSMGPDRTGIVQTPTILQDVSPSPVVRPRRGRPRNHRIVVDPNDFTGIGLEETRRLGEEKEEEEEEGLSDDSGPVDNSTLPIATPSFLKEMETPAIVKRKQRKKAKLAQDVSPNTAKSVSPPVVARQRKSGASHVAPVNISAFSDIDIDLDRSAVGQDMTSREEGVGGPASSLAVGKPASATLIAAIPTAATPTAVTPSAATPTASPVGLGGSQDYSTSATLLSSPSPVGKKRRPTQRGVKVSSHDFSDVSINTTGVEAGEGPAYPAGDDSRSTQPRELAEGGNSKAGQLVHNEQATLHNTSSFLSPVIIRKKKGRKAQLAAKVTSHDFSDISINTTDVVEAGVGPAHPVEKDNTDQTRELADDTAHQTVTHADQTTLANASLRTPLFLKKNKDRKAKLTAKVTAHDFSDISIDITDQDAGGATGTNRQQENSSEEPVGRGNGISPTGHHQVDAMSASAATPSFSGQEPDDSPPDSHRQRRVRSKKLTVGVTTRDFSLGSDQLDLDEPSSATGGEGERIEEVAAFLIETTTTSGKDNGSVKKAAQRAADLVGGRRSRGGGGEFVVDKRQGESQLELSPIVNTPSPRSRTVAAAARSSLARLSTTGRSATTATPPKDVSGTMANSMSAAAGERFTGTVYMELDEYGIPDGQGCGLLDAFAPERDDPGTEKENQAEHPGDEDQLAEDFPPTFTNDEDKRLYFEAKKAERAARKSEFLGYVAKAPNLPNIVEMSSSYVTGSSNQNTLRLSSSAGPRATAASRLSRGEDQQQPQASNSSSGGMSVGEQIPSAEREADAGCGEGEEEIRESQSRRSSRKSIFISGLSQVPSELENVGDMTRAFDPDVNSTKLGNITGFHADLSPVELPHNNRSRSRPPYTPSGGRSSQEVVEEQEGEGASPRGVNTSTPDMAKSRGVRTTGNKLSPLVNSPLGSRDYLSQSQPVSRYDRLHQRRLHVTLAENNLRKQINNFNREETPERLRRSEAGVRGGMVSQLYRTRLMNEDIAEGGTQTTPTLEPGAVQTEILPLPDRMSRGKSIALSTTGCQVTPGLQFLQKLSVLHGSGLNSGNNSYSEQHLTSNNSRQVSRNSVGVLGASDLQEAREHLEKLRTLEQEIKGSLENQKGDEQLGEETIEELKEKLKNVVTEKEIISNIITTGRISVDCTPNQTGTPGNSSSLLVTLNTPYIDQDEHEVSLNPNSSLRRLETGEYVEDAVERSKATSVTSVATEPEERGPDSELSGADGNQEEGEDVEQEAAEDYQEDGGEEAETEGDHQRDEIQDETRGEYQGAQDKSQENGDEEGEEEQQEEIEGGDRQEAAVGGEVVLERLNNSGVAGEEDQQHSGSVLPNHVGEPTLIEERSLPTGRERKGMRQMTLERYLGVAPDASVSAGLTFLETPRPAPGPSRPPGGPAPRARPPKPVPTSVFPLKEVKFQFQRFSRYKLAPDGEEPLMDASRKFLKMYLERCSEIARGRGDSVIRPSDMRQVMGETGLVARKEDDPTNRRFNQQMYDTVSCEYYDELVPMAQGFGGKLYPPKEIWDVKIVGKARRASSSNNRRVKKTKSDTQIKRIKVSKDLHERESCEEDEVSGARGDKPARRSASSGASGSKAAGRTASSGASGSKSARRSASSGASGSKPARRSASSGASGSKAARRSASSGASGSQPARRSASSGASGRKAVRKSATSGKSARPEANSKQGGKKSGRAPIEVSAEVRSGQVDDENSQEEEDESDLSGPASPPVTVVPASKKRGRPQTKKGKEADKGRKQPVVVAKKARKSAEVHSQKGGKRSVDQVEMEKETEEERLVRKINNTQGPTRKRGKTGK